MAVTNQGFSSFSSDAVTYIAEKTLMIAKKAVIFQQFGDKAVLPPGSSKTFQYTRYDRLNLPISSLTDGSTPDNTSMSISTVSATADQWGAYINITDVAQLTIKHPVLQKGIELMAYQAAETVDREIIKVLNNSATNVTYGHNGSGFAASRSALTTSYILNTASVKSAVATLRNNGAVEYDGQNYIGVIDPSVEMDVMGDSTFVNASSYSNIKALYNGEIGMWFGVRWMRSNFIPAIVGIAAQDLTGSTSGGSLATGNYNSYFSGQNPNTGVYDRVTANDVANVASGSSGSITGSSPNVSGYTWDLYVSQVGATANTGAYYLQQSSIANNTAITTIQSISTTTLGLFPGANGVTVHDGFIFGKEAYTTVDLMQLQSFITPASASDSDPLVQRRKAGWKLMFKAVVNNVNFIQKLEVGSAY